MGIYDRYLALRVRTQSSSPPDHVALIITERDLLEPDAFETLEEFFEWAFTYGASTITVYVSVLDEGAIPSLRHSLSQVSAPKPVSIHGPNDETYQDAPIQISVGLGGKHEFTEAVQEIAERAVNGELNPEEISEQDIEQSLAFPEAPDLIIKTGEERLSDFMIWQSVYSELYFTDVNWRDFRRRDFLRAIREYKNRTRRFGE
ncbi:undecaprenyl diphosphate synthase family protein [Salinarchaeum sp. IM2453]|uniref:undecaprenyl diphosphate synthase family protein n=1 Tax=Salinarchaeum sp. IM2453 TaxID=2862870 RepID=UPI001C82CEB0|nr:undecaprenyl diphosphate synthase family protein [Salinarchaeum sp. IM2453]QZA88855.1 undecaprenyl diphosphate synthase family protein [Salinarchaeum sp. IM2453]